MQHVANYMISLIQIPYSECTFAWTPAVCGEPNE